MADAGDIKALESSFSTSYYCKKILKILAYVI